VTFLLLDVRYSRDQPSSSGDILGDAQWQWLEAELNSARNSSDLYILISGTQVLASTVKKESWRQYPKAFQRLVKLVSQAPAPVLMLSGDRHFAEFSQVESSGAFPLIDVTSSGLNSSKDKANDNDFRIKPPVTQDNFATISIDLEGEAPKVNADIRSSQSGAVLSTLEIDYGAGTVR
jgi:alkaline phosphatase D